MTDQQLAEAYRRAVQARATGRPADMPLERLEALAAGRLAEAEAAELLDRVMSDPELMREFELLRAVHQAGVRAGPARRWMLPTAIAATAVFAIGGTLLYRGRLAAERQQLRGAERTEVVSLLSPIPGANVTRPVEMIWRSVPDAAPYRVSVVDQNGDAVFTGATADTTLLLPDSVLQEGAPYRWWVETTVPAGVVRSAPQRFVLTR
jgi:hypothetical protein